MEKTKSIFEKIQNVRVGLQKATIKMSGKNTYAGYEYFELADFLPKLNELMLEQGMTAIPSFTNDTATLTAINFDNSSDTYTITSPFSSAELKGCHAVQNIGAVETYQRRYLYQAMFDIAESDGLNATQGKKDDKADKSDKSGKPTNNASQQTTAQNKKQSKESPENSLPYPDLGVSEKKPLKDELKVQRQMEIQEMQGYYYQDDEGFMSRLTAHVKAQGCKISELSEKDYIELLRKIKNKEI